ncbi:hypothetical protein SESBI_03665 [Sesbania bispinosa]|nr:hypothetical protein SESBI_03665 [Sesbania bispinosa]
MPAEDDNPTKLKRSHSSNRCKRCLNYGHNIRKCPLPPSEPEGDAQTTNVNSQTADKGKQTMERNSSVQQPSTKIQRTNKEKGRWLLRGANLLIMEMGRKAQNIAPKAQKGKNQAPKTARQAQKGKKEAPKTATKAPKTAPQGQHASSSQPKNLDLDQSFYNLNYILVQGNKKESTNLEAEGVQVEVPPIPAYAKNLTVAQLLARMMTANNTWVAVVTAHSEIHSTPSDVTMQEAEAVMPTQNSQVGGEKEDGSPNPN